MDIGQPDSF